MLGIKAACLLYFMYGYGYLALLRLGFDTFSIISILQRQRMSQHLTNVAHTDVQSKTRSDLIVTDSDLCQG